MGFYNIAPQFAVEGLESDLDLLNSMQSACFTHISWDLAHCKLECCCFPARDGDSKCMSCKIMIQGIWTYSFQLQEWVLLSSCQLLVRVLSGHWSSPVPSAQGLYLVVDSSFCSWWGDQSESHGQPVTCVEAVVCAGYTSLQPGEWLWALRSALTWTNIAKGKSSVNMQDTSPPFPSSWPHHLLPPSVIAQMSWLPQQQFQVTTGPCQWQ